MTQNDIQFFYFIIIIIIILGKTSSLGIQTYKHYIYNGNKQNEWINQSVSNCSFLWRKQPWDGASQGVFFFFFFYQSVSCHFSFLHIPRKLARRFLSFDEKEEKKNTFLSNLSGENNP